MPDIIQLLPDAIANQIAAGEVIQRPASAVKELLENAVDAGATSIKLIIKDAGKQLIQVIDNGCGMSETDARMCYERHATSKISTVDDLFAIRTMGFRGEAMASIAAIAQVEMKTKRREDELGTQLFIEGAEVKKHEPVQTADGTNIAVRNLFYNVPARRIFLKSNPVETRHIIDEFTRIALANPELQFELHNNGLQVYHLPQGNLRQRIVHLFGNGYNNKLVPVEEKTSVVNIFGFIGKPEAAKRTRGEQFFFVNRRFIKSGYLNHAVAAAYNELLQKDAFPFYAIFLDIDPAHIDVNVHPTKQEIKFDDEKIIYAFVNTAAKGALAKYSITPTLDFDRETAFDKLDAFNTFTPPPKPFGSQQHEDVLTKEKPFITKTDFTNRQQLKHWEKLYEGLKQDSNTVTLPSDIPATSKEEHATAIEDFTDKQIAPFQLHNRFIVSQIKSGFILIDQQAAHQRILFEKYLKGLEQNNLTTQQQLFPETLHLSPADTEMLKELLPDLRALGFDLQEFGGQSFVIHGIPSDLKHGEEKDWIETLLEQCKQSAGGDSRSVHDRIAMTMAKKASIKTGDRLSESEMKHLIDRLFACEAPYVAPNGQLTFLTFEMNELEKLFERRK